MAYDKYGRPIVDGKPLDEALYEEEAFVHGLTLDAHEVAARHQARIKRLKQKASLPALEVVRGRD
jgi:hypothetical protein